MVDLHTVCSMCGDVGFPDKLFRCSKCFNRFQHSYCSNYYTESSIPIEVCDWCRSEVRNSSSPSPRSSSKKHSSSPRSISVAGNSRSDYSGNHKVKQNESAEKGKSPSPSPRPSGRKYRLLKDVMC